MKLQQNPGNQQYFLNLPKSLVSALGWQPKDEIKISVGEKQSLVIRRAE